MVDSKAEKANFERRAEEVYKEAEALAQQGHNAGSETLKHNSYEAAQQKFDIAQTLDNCGKAIKGT